jgi:septum site-determining protein MinC
MPLLYINPYMNSDAFISSPIPPTDNGPSDSDSTLPIIKPLEESDLFTNAPLEGSEDTSQEQEQRVRIKSEGGKLVITLPPEVKSGSNNPAAAPNWNEISQQIKQRLHAGERLWQSNTAVHLNACDRLLDGRQLQEIADSLTELKLQLKRVHTSRRQTAVAAATAGYSVEQEPSIPQLNQSGLESAQALADPLYLQTTLRSGGDVRHDGTVIILGDLNPGSSVVADGDILVWGRLRGVAHAGAKGNARCLIMALQMEPTQVRIADFVARAPETPLSEYYPEVAYVTPQGAIRIARALDFYRSQTIGHKR